MPCEGAVILRALHVSWPVVGGANAVGTVEVSDPAPAGGLTIALSGSRPGLATVPPSVTVLEGESVANFTIATQQTAVNRGVVVRATYAAQLRPPLHLYQRPIRQHHIHRRRRECRLHPHLRLRRPPSPLRVTDALGLAPVKNNSPGGVFWYKPEDCTTTPCPILECKPGETCDVDGLYPPDCKSKPIKIPNGCSGTVDAKGKLKVNCSLKGIIGGWLKGSGQVDDEFMKEHKDWAPPNQGPGCVKKNACN